MCVFFPKTDPSFVGRWFFLYGKAPEQWPPETHSGDTRALEASGPRARAFRRAIPRENHPPKEDRPREWCIFWKRMVFHLPMSQGRHGIVILWVFHPVPKLKKSLGRLLMPCYSFHCGGQGMILSWTSSDITSSLSDIHSYLVHESTPCSWLLYISSCPFWLESNKTLERFTVISSFEA